MPKQSKTGHRPSRMAVASATGTSAAAMTGRGRITGKPHPASYILSMVVALGNQWCKKEIDQTNKSQQHAKSHPNQLTSLTHSAQHQQILQAEPSCSKHLHPYLLRVNICDRLYVD